MKTTSVFFAIICSTLLLGAHGQAATGSAAGFAVTSTDTTDFPLTISTGGSTSFYFSSGSSPAVASSASGAAAASPPTGTTASYTATYKTATGIPVAQVWTLSQQTSGTGSAIGFTVQLSIGSQVALTVVPSGATTSAGTVQTTSTAIISTLTTCGNYFIDCVAGNLYFNMYIPATASATCVVTITQYAAVVGILQYPTSSVATSPYTTVTTAISAANTATSPTSTICGSAVSGSNTLLYFISTYGTSTGTAQTTAYNAVNTAAKSGGIASNTGSLVTNLQTSDSAGFAAPSASASNIAAVSKSQGKIVAVAGLFTTAVATVFGLAL